MLANEISRPNIFCVFILRKRQVNSLLYQFHTYLVPSLLLSYVSHIHLPFYFPSYSNIHIKLPINQFIGFSYGMTITTRGHESQCLIMLFSCLSYSVIQEYFTLRAFTNIILPWQVSICCKLWFSTQRNIQLGHSDSKQKFKKHDFFAKLFDYYLIVFLENTQVLLHVFDPIPAFLTNP